MIKYVVNKFLVALFLSLSLAFSCAYAGQFQAKHQPVALSKALYLEQTGTLKHRSGYLYLDVSNKFISDLLPLLQTRGKITPPSGFGKKGSKGAHISVIYKNELNFPIGMLPELGKKFSFYVLDIGTAQKNKKGVDQKIWMIRTVSPELEKLRKKYGLSPLCHGEDFHITLGSQSLHKRTK